jgi:hypothetical protein
VRVCVWHCVCVYDAVSVRAPCATMFIEIDLERPVPPSAVTPVPPPVAEQALASA